MKQLTIQKCAYCKKVICCKQKTCANCRIRARDNRLKHIQRERTYQSQRWAHRAVVHSKIADKNKNRTYKPRDYITHQRLRFLRTLLKNKCVYCQTEMQTENRRLPNGLSVERINRKLPHVKSNVFLCCFRCNCVGGRGMPGPIIQQCFYELKNKHFMRQLRVR